MKRRQLLEIEDQEWCPAPLREAMTDYLRQVLTISKPYRVTTGLLSGLLERSSSRRVVDLGSGGGGPWPSLIRPLASRFPELEVTFTDLYPNLSALGRLSERDPAHFSVHEARVDATSVAGGLTGVRTLFTSFHHFPPEKAQRIVLDAAKAGSGLAVFEVTERSVTSLAVCLLSPLFCLLTMLFARPFRWRNIVLTYLIPVCPLAVCFDGIVSCLRSYTVPELEAFARDAQREVPGQQWRAGSITVPATLGLLKVTYLVLEPKTATS